MRASALQSARAISGVIRYPGAASQFVEVGPSQTGMQQERWGQGRSRYGSQQRHADGITAEPSEHGERVGAVPQGGGGQRGCRQLLRQTAVSFANQHHDEENIEARSERKREKPKRVSDGKHLRPQSSRP